MSFGQQMVRASASEWEQIKQVDQARRQRQAITRAQRDAELAANATEETRRKLHRPVIDRLHEQGKLPDTSHRAAEEIARVFHQVTTAVTCRVANLDRAGGGGGANDFVPQIFTSGYQDRYLPWTVDMSRQPNVAGRGRVDLVLCMVVDNYGPRQIADRLGSDQRTILEAIRAALFRYAELAGWTSAADYAESPLLAAFAAE